MDGWWTAKDREPTGAQLVQDPADQQWERIGANRWVPLAVDPPKIITWFELCSSASTGRVRVIV